MSFILHASPFIGLIIFMRQYQANKESLSKDPATITTVFMGGIYSILVFKLHISQFMRPIMGCMNIVSRDIDIYQIRYFSRVCLLVSFLVENIPLLWYQVMYVTIYDHFSSFYIITIVLGSLQAIFFIWQKILMRISREFDFKFLMERTAYTVICAGYIVWLVALEVLMFGYILVIFFTYDSYQDDGFATKSIAYELLSHEKSFHFVDGKPVKSFFLYNFSYYFLSEALNEKLNKYQENWAENKMRCEIGEIRKSVRMYFIYNTLMALSKLFLILVANIIPKKFLYTRVCIMNLCIL